MNNPINCFSTKAPVLVELYSPTRKLYSHHIINYFDRQVQPLHWSCLNPQHYEFSAWPHFSHHTTFPIRWAWMSTTAGMFTALTLTHHELACKQHSRPNPVIQQKPHTGPVRTGAHQNHFLTRVTYKLTLPFMSWGHFPQITFSSQITELTLPYTPHILFTQLKIWENKN